jgi:hypothetical protein
MGAHVGAANGAKADGHGAVGATPAEVAVASALEAIPSAAAAVENAQAGQQAGVIAHQLAVRAHPHVCTHSMQYCAASNASGEYATREHEALLHRCACAQCFTLAGQWHKVMGTSLQWSMYVE